MIFGKTAPLEVVSCNLHSPPTLDLPSCSLMLSFVASRYGACSVICNSSKSAKHTSSWWKYLEHHPKTPNFSIFYVLLKNIFFKNHQNRLYDTQIRPINTFFAWNAVFGRICILRKGEDFHFCSFCRKTRLMLVAEICISLSRTNSDFFSLSPVL